MPLFGTKQEKLNARLFKAAGNGHAAKVAELLDAGADVNAYDDSGDKTPLFHAVVREKKEVALLLLQRGANANFAREDKYTALMEASGDGNREIVEALIAKGADVNARADNGRTSLYRAAASGRGDVVKVLLEHGADPDISDSRLNTPADAAQKNYPRVAALIRKAQKPEPEPEPEAAEPRVSASGAPSAGPVDGMGEGWRLTAPDEVANVALRPALGYRLTEVFNFTSRTYMRIARNLETVAESQSLRFFDEFRDAAPLDRARAALESLGGRAAATSDGALEKPVMPAPKPRRNGGNAP